MDSNTPIRQLGGLNAQQLVELLLYPSAGLILIGTAGFAFLEPFCRRWALAAETLLVCMVIVVLPTIALGVVTDGTPGQIISAVLKLWAGTIPKALVVFSIFAWIFRILAEETARDLAVMVDRLGPRDAMKAMALICAGVAGLIIVRAYRP